MATCQIRFAAGPLQHGAVRHHSQNWRNRPNATRRKRGKTYVILAVLLVAAFVIYLASQSSNNTNTITNTGGTTTVLATGTDVGDAATDFSVTLLDGSQTMLSNYRGHTVLLWFVTTWCSSCQEGAQLLSSQYYSELRSKGVTIIVVMLYENLGQPGPSLAQFANTYGGGSTKPGWLYGTAPAWVTSTYDPASYLDLYYLINSQGVIMTTGVGLPGALPSIASSV